MRTISNAGLAGGDDAGLAGGDDAGLAGGDDARLVGGDDVRLAGAGFGFGFGFGLDFAFGGRTCELALDTTPAPSLPGTPNAMAAPTTAVAQRTRTTAYLRSKHLRSSPLSTHTSQD
jgi:hypothetical protein